MNRLAAIERQGVSFFSNSPQAYFIDNVKAATKEKRTPPDWWRDLRKKELEVERQQEQSKTRLLREKTDDKSFDAYLAGEARDAFAKVMERLTEDFRNAGKSEPEARSQAARLARTHFHNRYQKGNNEASDATGFSTIGSLSGMSNGVSATRYSKAPSTRLLSRRKIDRHNVTSSVATTFNSAGKRKRRSRLLLGHSLCSPYSPSLPPRFCPHREPRGFRNLQPKRAIAWSLAAPGKCSVHIR